MHVDQNEPTGRRRPDGVNPIRFRMSPLGTALTTWSAIEAFVGIYYAVLWERTRRRRPEHLVFACLCLAFAIYAVGGAQLVEARDLADSTLALRIQYAGGVVLPAFGLDFGSRMAGIPGRRTVGAAYAAGTLALVLDATGSLFDSHRPAVEGPFAVPASDAWSEPALRPLGATVIALAVAMAIVVSITLFARPGRDRDARLLLFGSALSTLAAIHDGLARLCALRSLHLLEHASVITILLFDGVMLRNAAAAATKLERRTEELARSYEELRHMQEELVRKEQLAAVGELSAVIAHEVRNPLAILKNAVSSLRQPSLSPADRSTLLRILDEETDRLNRLVRDLLAYARPLSPKLGAVEIEPLVRNAIELARGGRRESSDVEIELALGAGPTVLLGDAELLRHAFVNVIDNALQAMPAGGRLRVECRGANIEGRPAAALSFHDSGEGMDTLVRAKAIDPFFTTRAAGTGLGLAIVGRVVKSHGGALNIQSQPGAGTVVTLVIPTPE
jgi:signal transduction histidine kinase